VQRWWEADPWLQLGDPFCMNPYYRFFQYQQSIGVLLPEYSERSFQVRIRRCHSEP
jgi:hypothetical protein